MNIGWYKNEPYKTLGINITKNAIKEWYLTIDLWWWYIEIQCNKEKYDGE